ncbi:MAG: hypothetical protein WB709_03205, partial [Solirubrobacteraceae bacterium]
EEALRGARTRMARKPPALARELLRNFPKRRARNNRRRRNKGTAKATGAGTGVAAASAGGADTATKTADTAAPTGDNSQDGTGAANAGNGKAAPKPSSRRRGGSGKRAKKSQTPSDAVLDEALTSEAAGSGSSNGSGLAPAEEGKLDRNVAEALEHAEE